jgi:SSS family solute:Na+ symporter
MGGWGGLKDKVEGSALKEGGLHAWQNIGVGNVTSDRRRWIAIVFGLGFVLSFGYWTTNFAEVQRALSAKNLSAARRTPLIGAYPKILIPALTIIPGLVALVSVKGLGGSNPDLQYNNAIPLLIGKYLPEGMLGLAVTGLLAAFMAGVAANVSAFNTVVTTDLVEPYLRRAVRRLVRQLRPHRDGRRIGLDLHGAHRVDVLEPHELPAGAVLDLQRAAVRDVHHRHVLAPDDARRGSLGPHTGTIAAGGTFILYKLKVISFGSDLAESMWGAGWRS